MCVLPACVQVPSAINGEFDRLEAIHGEVFVQRALSYLTGSRSGLSSTEAIDVCSLDDDVLRAVFEWWMPSVVKLPSAVWLTLRDDLAGLLVGGNGPLKWYHRQVRESAEHRYPCSDEHRQLLCSYWSAEWCDRVKPFELRSGAKVKLSGKEDMRRYVPAQPLILSGKLANPATDDCVINSRRCEELAFQRLRCGDFLAAAEELACGLVYTECRFRCGQGFQYVHELVEAATKCAALFGGYEKHRDSDVDVESSLRSESNGDEGSLHTSGRGDCSSHPKSKRRGVWSNKSSRGGGDRLGDVKGATGAIRHARRARGYERLVRASATLLAQHPERTLSAALAQPMNSWPHREAWAERNRRQAVVDWASSRQACVLLPKLRKAGGLQMRLQGHAGAVMAVCISLEADSIVSGGHDAILRRWDVATGECVQFFEGHDMTITTVAMSATKLILSGGWDCSVRVWDERAGECLAVLSGHTSTVTSVDVTEDGSRAISASEDFSIRAWDVVAAACLHTYSGMCEDSPEGHTAGGERPHQPHSSAPFPWWTHCVPLPSALPNDGSRSYQPA